MDKILYIYQYTYQTVESKTTENKTNKTEKINKASIYKQIARVKE